MSVIINLTLNEYVGLWVNKEQDTATIIFKDTDITFSSEVFNKLKEDILEQERLIKREDSATIEMDGKFSSKREILLKELIKTIDKIHDLDEKVDEKYAKEYTKLLEKSAYPSQKEMFELQQTGNHLIKEREKLKVYKERLEAQLEYGDLK